MLIIKYNSLGQTVFQRQFGEKIDLKLEMTHSFIYGIARCFNVLFLCRIVHFNLKPVSQNVA